MHLRTVETSNLIQGGAERTDTFQMVIDNIWKQGKISETIYKYVQVCYLLPTDYKLIFWTSGRWSLFTSMHCCQRVWKLPYTRLRRSSSIATTSSTTACLSSWIVMIRLRNTRSFRNPHRKKSGTVRSGDRAGKAMSPKLRTQITHCRTFQRSVATDHMKWRPLLYRSPSRQPRPAIAPAQYSNLKCVSRFHATLYKNYTFFESLIYTSPALWCFLERAWVRRSVRWARNSFLQYLQNALCLLSGTGASQPVRIQNPIN